jgi:hypothetical protein
MDAWGWLAAVIISLLVAVLVFLLFRWLMKMAFVQPQEEPRSDPYTLVMQNEDRILLEQRAVANYDRLLYNNDIGPNKDSKTVKPNSTRRLYEHAKTVLMKEKHPGLQQKLQLLALKDRANIEDATGFSIDEYNTSLGCLKAMALVATDAPIAIRESISQIQKMA